MNHNSSVRTMRDRGPVEREDKAPHVIDPDLRVDLASVPRAPTPLGQPEAYSRLRIKELQRQGHTYTEATRILDAEVNGTKAAPESMLRAPLPTNPTGRCGACEGCCHREPRPCIAWSRAQPESVPQDLPAGALPPEQLPPPKTDRYAGFVEMLTRLPVGYGLPWTTAPKCHKSARQCVKRWIERTGLNFRTYLDSDGRRFVVRCEAKATTPKDAAK